jgi:hypothetical protein
MGSVFQKTFTRPVPKGAEIVRRGNRRIARWKIGPKWTEAEVIVLGDGREVVHVHSKTYYAKYRDANGTVILHATGCKDKSAAERVLHHLEVAVERIKSGVVTAEEVHRAERMSDGVGIHIDRYIGAMLGSKDHRAKTEHYVRTLARACDWSCLADMRRTDLETWLAAEAKKGRSVRSRNAHRRPWCRSATGASNPPGS